MSALIECKNLTKRFGNKVALDNVNLFLEPGHIIGLLGPNGSGKTTLIKLINGLIQASEGELYIDESPVGPKTKSIISYLPDKTYLEDSWRVSAVFKYFEEFYADFDIERARDMLRKLGINEDTQLRTMSKGTKEKVQLILVMSRRAKLYILDEPIAGVDPAARDYILDTILSNYDEDATILISTHLISDVENILDHVIFIKDGHIVLDAEVDDIRSNEGKSVDTYFREVFRC